MFSQATLLLALAASASAHMTLNYPTPFGTPSSSPLTASNFPCQLSNGYSFTQINKWDAGTTQVVSFTGSAVHGGGSCQFSITTDPEPTANSQWKVIQSVVGGCPSNVTGNLPDNPEGHGAATFPVTMPTNIPSGRYTFAWTWLNKIGQREFYMNCAPIQVGSATGTASTASVASALGSLPDMFVANIPNTECATTEKQDFNYPDPGQVLIKGSGASPGSTLTGAGCAKMIKLGAGDGEIGSLSTGTSSQGTPIQSSSAASLPMTSEKSVATPVPSSMAPSVSTISSSPGGIFAPGASSAPSSQSAVQPTTLVASPIPSATPAAPNTSSPASSDCTPCTNDGAVVCIGSKQFGLCNRGCAVAQDLAAGMVCTNGVVGGAAKRHVHFPRAHLRRGLSAARVL